MLTGWGLKATAGLSGFQAWLANMILNVLWKWAQTKIKKLKTYFTTKKQNEEGLKKYEEQINKPEATPEDIKKAGKDFLQS